jgi:hypothetical protein
MKALAGALALWMAAPAMAQGPGLSIDAVKQASGYVTLNGDRYPSGEDQDVSGMPRLTEPGRLPVAGRVEIDFYGERGL